MKKLMFLALVTVFVSGMSIPSVGAAPYLQWDVGQDGIFDTEATLNVGEVLVVDLWATGIPDSGAASFEVGHSAYPEHGMKYNTSVLQPNDVTVNTTDWMHFPYADWTSVSGRISAGGGGPLGIGNIGNVKLITIDFEGVGVGSETFDFTEDEIFRLGRLGEGEFTVDKSTYALTASVVPEPASLLLLGSGLLGLVGFSRRKRKV